ncbi:SOS response-associated peptidase [Marinospirillum alkaliphilum]|uniref:Abasic site processing protein n=1 Tax=Marinospirillum alkaliphilum DSM 21637 TaxID=1122209 RepID=A0A1K1ZUG3_9GAMM|nr:SOS response-associated peptidase [Marinospirillum alkaliphilum]SFX77785.1 Putative SOS response-associated peptidase YedK [Marinospirillum alkaliphilum DSM 21637]
MSGRLIVTPYNPEQELGLPVTRMAELRTGFNLAPCSTLSILRQLDNKVILDDAFWSFTPAWMKQLDQAPYMLRSESVTSSPMYSESFATRRCLLPVTGYYVWVQLSRGKHPFAIRMQHNRPFFLAGLWTRYPVAPGRHYDSFGLISVAADPWLARLTDRIPLKLPAEQAQQWLHPDTSKEQLQSLLLTEDQELECYPVSPLVNDPANQHGQVATPVAERRRRSG